MGKKLMPCKTCGNEIAASAKKCPHCGAKNKKPIYKKWWLWVIVVIAVIGIASSNEHPETAEPAPALTQTASKQETPADTEPESTDPEDTIVSEDEAIQPEPEEIPTADASAPEPEADSNISLRKLNALGSAKSYLSFMAFSYDGLVDQLEFEGYSNEEAVYAADHCGADWNEQAAKSAKSYLDMMSFSRQGLIDQLVFEGYTEDQAVYGVTANGY